MKKNLSDYIVALGVLLCSLGLLAALTFALTGWRHKESGRTLSVDFPDVTGIRIHSEVRYAGAPAGTVTSVRLLTAEERAAAADETAKKNAVRVSLRLFESVPSLPADVRASIASDTLLSEKFIAFSAGTHDAPKLADGAMLQGFRAGSFDDVLNSIGPILQSVDQALASLQPLMKNANETVSTLKTGVADLLPRVNKVADSAKMAATSAEDLLKRADKLIADNEAGVKGNLDELKAAIAKLQDALKSVDGFVGSTDKQLAGRMQELSVVLQNLKVATTHAKAAFQTIGEHPHRLLFSEKNPPKLPTEQEILRSSKPVPIPAR